MWNIKLNLFTHSWFIWRLYICLFILRKNKENRRMNNNLNIKYLQQNDNMIIIGDKNKKYIQIVSKYCLVFQHNSKNTLFWNFEYILYIFFYKRHLYNSIFFLFYFQYMLQYCMKKNHLSNPIRFPTSAKALTARCTSSRVCAALNCTRTRAPPLGTTG